MSGKMCASLAGRGSCGIWSWPVCVDLILLPSGIVATIPCGLLLLLEIGVVGIRKCPVQPVSAMAKVVGQVVGGEGLW